MPRCLAAIVKLPSSTTRVKTRIACSWFIFERHELKDFLHLPLMRLSEILQLGKTFLNLRFASYSHERPPLNEWVTARHTSLAKSKILVNGLKGGCALPHGSRHSLD